MKRFPVLLLVVLTAVLAPAPTAQSNDLPKYSRPSLSKLQTTDDSAPVSINNLFSYFWNNGMGALNPYTLDDGVEYLPSVRQAPYGPYPITGPLMFSEGLLWGGRLRGRLALGGSAFKSGLQAGSILSPGTEAHAPRCADPASARYRVYRVRPDLPPAVDFTQAEALLGGSERYLLQYEVNATPRSIYEAYCRDWTEWPASDGAPYTDVDHNGSYDPSIDTPGVPGADQTLWYVANDLDSVRTKSLYGTLPIGIEMQKTIWVYSRPGALANTIFQRSRLINKSGAQIDSMFLMQFCDPDIGGSLGYTDDYAACDTIRNMAYAYNATDRDGFFGAKAPAIGIDILAGPIVRASASDSAFVDFSFRRGWKNLPMTSMVFIQKIWNEPIEGDSRGGLELYNLMRGFQKSGQPVVNPETGRPTTFVFPGDPVGHSGWVEGKPYSPGVTLSPADRRLGLASGPFTMAPSDTQEFLIAEIVGAGSTRLGSVSALRANDQEVDNFFRQGFRQPALPAAPAVHVTELNREILLTWTDQAAAQQIERYAQMGYAFQGYTVYQLPDGDFSKRRRVATYDIADDITTIVDTVYDESTDFALPRIMAYGSNSLIQRFHHATADSLTGSRLVNGRKYVFAVTSYVYHPSASTGMRVIESAPAIVEAVPQTPPAGHAVPARFGQLLSEDLRRVTRTGIKPNQVFVRVIDPTAITGHTYTLTFSSPDSGAPWSVFDATAGREVIRNWTNYSKLPYPKYVTQNDPSDPVVDGLQFSVSSAPASSAYEWKLSTAGLERVFLSGQAADELQRINVYPNPYFTGNTDETRPYDHFVTFNHLPRKAVINILTVSGQRVRLIVKDDPSQFLRWDLTNDSRAQVASGMYVIHIALPESGTQKMLKLAVIAPVLIPEHW